VDSFIGCVTVMWGKANEKNEEALLIMVGGLPFIEHEINFP